MTKRRQERMVVDADLLSREAARLAIGQMSERCRIQLVVTDRALRESEIAIDNRARDNAELKVGLWRRDGWIRNMAQDGLIRHIDRAEVREQREKNPEPYGWVARRWSEFNTDQTDVYYLYAGIATRASAHLSGNAAMIPDDEMELFNQQRPEGVPKIARRDDMLAAFAERLGCTPRECLEASFVTISPNHADYAALMKKVLPSLRATFPKTAGGITARPHAHAHYVMLRQRIKPTPTSRRVQQERK